MVVDPQVQAWPRTQAIRGAWEPSLPFLGGHRTFKLPGEGWGRKGWRQQRGSGYRRDQRPILTLFLPPTLWDLYFCTPLEGAMQLGLPWAVVSVLLKGA